jgi:hypothetical protein
MHRGYRQVLFILIVTACFQSTATAASSRSEALSSGLAAIAPGLDVAAMTLRPGDVGQPGWVHDGAFVERLDSEARNEAAYLGRGTSAESVAAKLSAMGWGRMYVDTLIVPSPATPNAPAQRIRSYITEYASAEGAAAGFAYLEDESAIPSAKDIAASRTFGDASELTEDRGVSAVDGRTYRSLDLTFRAGNLVAGVTLIVYPSKTAVDPQPSAVEALGTILEARVKTPLTNGAGLGRAVARLAPTDRAVTTYDDAYYRLGRADIPVSDESVAATSLRVRTYAEATDVYQLWQGIDASASAGVLYGVTLLHFPSEAAAAAWVTNLQSILAVNPFYGQMRPIDGAPSIGDQSIALGYAAGGGANAPRAVLVAVRVGAYVARVHVVPQGQTRDIPVAPVIALAGIEAGCLSGDACGDVLTLPEGLIVTSAGATPVSA